MIKQNYTGDSNTIKRIVAILNKKAPLPLDQQGEVDWGTDGKVLGTDGVGGTKWVDPGSGGGDVTDVEVNGTSVVNAQGVAEVSVPTATSDLTNDSGFITSADVPTKTSDLTNDSGFITSADVPTKTSDLTNDSGFITNLVNNLANYYTKSQTYTQAEVDALISGIVTLNILVVQTLPTQDISTTTIYLVPKQDTGTSDIYDEYLYINNAWELIGTTQIDLSNYVTTTDLSTALADYVTSVGLATILAGYAQISDLPTVNDGTLTIQQNGTTVGTFSANQSGDTTVNLTGGGGSGGHTIEDSGGTAMTQRAGLQFVGATVTDDSVDDRTVVTIPTPTTYSAGTGIDINSNTISAKLKQSTLSVESSVTRTAVSNREYMVEMDSDGYLAVNVPWVAQQQSDWNETSTSSKSYIQNKPTLGGAASQAVANNVTTTAAGSVLDARQGKTLNDARKALIIGKKVYVTASIGPGVDYPISCTIPTGYLPLSVTGSSYMNDQGILGSPYYATSGTTKCRWKNLNTVTVTLNSQMCVFYFVKNEITVS